MHGYTNQYTYIYSYSYIDIIARYYTCQWTCSYSLAVQLAILSYFKYYSDMQLYFVSNGWDKSTNIKYLYVNWYTLVYKDPS